MNPKRRRVLISISALALPALAQQPAVARIGWISPDRSSGGSPQFEAFREGLRKLGYVDGRNLIIDAYWGEGSSERIEQLAAELVKSKPHIIVTQGGDRKSVV